MKNQKMSNDNINNKGFDFDKNDNFGNFEDKPSKKVKDMKKLNNHFEKEKKPVRIILYYNI